jgi:predicted DsbA family dithiol-disulfide isomerase
MLRVDVYSDVVCPWCFIGTRRLARALAARADADAAVVEHHPYLLHPDAPREGLDLREMLARKYAADPERLIARVEAAAREAGLPLDFSRVRRTYSTVDAHTLLRHSRGAGTQRELADALFTAYFVEGRNVADPVVLADLAGRHGIDGGGAARLLADDAERAQTVREADEARRAGIQGVPLFVCNERYVISGAQPLDVFERALASAAGEMR